MVGWERGSSNWHIKQWLFLWLWVVESHGDTDNSVQIHEGVDQRLFCMCIFWFCFLWFIVFVVVFAIAGSWLAISDHTVELYFLLVWVYLMNLWSYTLKLIVDQGFRIKSSLSSSFLLLNAIFDALKHWIEIVISFDLLLPKLFVSSFLFRQQIDTFFSKRFRLKFLVENSVQTSSFLFLRSDGLS